MPTQAQIDQLSEARAAHANARAELLRTDELLRQLESRSRTLSRSMDPQHADEAHKLQEQLTAARAKKSSAASKVKGALDQLKGLHDLIAPQVDPRDALTKVSSDLPILLLPLRLETRFARPANGPAELLVRIYPDDALIDTFEPTLSTTEADSAVRFWSGWWKSQGDDALRHAYWRDLVAGCGSARGRYAALEHQPLEGRDPDATAMNADVLLIVHTFTPLAGAEKDAMLAFTKALWRAGADPVKQQAAFDVLVTATSAARAAAISKTYTAFNASEEVPAGLTRDTCTVEVRQLTFPDPGTLSLRNTSWSTQPHVDLLPERFVLVLERGTQRTEVLGAPVLTPLAVGPDPRAPKEEQYQPDANGDLVVPIEQRWLVDFDTALNAGMAFRVQLDQVQAQGGFDRVYVTGVRLATRNTDSSGALKTLLDHHRQSSAGFRILPQGTPTNRTEDDGQEAVWQADDGYSTFLKELAGTSLLTAKSTSNWARTDGDQLREALGIPASTLDFTIGADSTDDGVGRAMNAALWPATMGYWMDTMMNTVFTDGAIGRTRTFFERYVTGRGALPAVLIGDQPYGILPTTAFSQLAFNKQTNGQDRFVSALYEKLALLRQRFWDGRGDLAAHVSRSTTDPQQLLLDIIGLHPSSVEFHQQWVQSARELWNRLTLAPAFDVSKWDDLLNDAFSMALLAELGHTGAKPDLLEKLFNARPYNLTGPVIDDRPLSEYAPIRDWTVDDRNYLEWLADAARTSLETLRKEEGFKEGKAPNALLYLMLRHALELGMYEAAVKFRAPVATATEQMAVRRESTFVHIEGKPASESRYAVLYDTDPRFTGGVAATVIERIIAEFDTASATKDLRQQKDALTFLADRSTASLERAFTEHIDLCTHRMDAWLLGIVRYRLEQMRERAPQQLAVGAYGYVEDLRPKAPARPRAVPEEEVPFFGNITANVEPSNQGFIHSLSHDHATTAAILRNGHVRNAVPTQPDLLAIDLSSERVRTAKGLIDGLRTGQSLGALLGYRFERGLHDRGGITELDAFILPIRLAFPLTANKQAETAEVDGTITTLEANNVVDGLALVEHIRSSGSRNYPWGKDLPTATTGQALAINAEVEKLHAVLDALADLTLAESVHQVARGNTDRAAAAMDMVSKGTFPIDPDVVRTPRSGTSLTHRLVLHLKADAPNGSTPRGVLEPSLNHWLRTVLPAPADVVLRVGRSIDGTPPVSFTTVSWGDLGLDAIDLLHMLDMHSEQGMNAIDDRVRHHVYTSGTVAGITPDWDLHMMYTEPVAGKVTFFEVAALVESLRQLVLGVKSWTPQDGMVSNEAVKTVAGGEVDRTRIQAAITDLEADIIAIKARIDAIDPLITSDPIDFGDILNAIDAEFTAYIDLQKKLGAKGITLSGFGGVMDAKRRWVAKIREHAKEHHARWTTKLALCDAKLAAAADPALNDYAKVELLKEAEAAISTVFVRTGSMAPPLVPVTFTSHINGLRAAFVAVHTRLQALETNTKSTFVELYTDWSNLVLDMDDHDPTAIDLMADQTPLIVLMQDLSRQYKGQVADLDARTTKANTKLSEADATTGKARNDLRTEAAKALFGEDVVILPRSAMDPLQAAEWTNSINELPARSATAQGLGMERPVDAWLYGVARVRPKAAALENSIILSEAFGTSAPSPSPMQFPHVPGEPWMAVQWPDTFDAQGTTERLLYTAIHAGGAFNSAAPLHCGLILDEWTEVIPAKEEVTSVAFHYDRPSTEAPQTWLLVTPAGTGETWTWSDLRNAIPETMQLARLRAMEPRALDDTLIARFLPATIAAVTARKVTIGVDLARNVKSERYIDTILDHG